MLPKVSITTPSYQQGAYIEDTICSVINQDYPNLEYVIFDGSSTDGSVDIIRAYENRLAFWKSEPDSGQANAINKGLSASSGEILGWLNADDVLLPGTIKRVVEYLTNHSDVDFVYGWVVHVNELGEPIRKKSNKSPRVFSLQTMIAGRDVSQPGSFWRRSAMDRGGILDESFHYILDYEYWTRLALTGTKFPRLEGAPVAQFRHSPSSKTGSQTYRFGIEEMRLLDMLAQEPLLEEKTGLTSRQLEKQFEHGRPRACLTAFYGLVRTPGQRQEALRWLWQAFRYHPEILYERWRLLASVAADLSSEIIGLNRR